MNKYNAWETDGVVATCVHSGILLGLFDPEDVGNMLLRNVGSLSAEYMALYPRR
jgi:hypothetical protein